jgi:hypothetical protein
MPAAVACLVSVLLVGCDPALDAYRPAAAMIPRFHLELIQTIELWDRSNWRRCSRFRPMIGPLSEKRDRR